MGENNSQIINFHFLNIIKNSIRNYKFILLFTLAVTIFAYIITYIIPHKYECQATLLPPEEAGPSNLAEFLKSFSNLPTVFGGTSRTKIQLYYEMLKSKELARYIAAKPEIKNFSLFKNLDSTKLVKTIYKSIDIELRQSGLFIISATTSTGFFPSAQKKKEAAIASAQIAKLAIQSLDSLVRTRISTRSKRKVVLIEKLLAEKRHQLDSIEKEIENFQTKNKIIALDEQSKAILSTAINIGSELAKSEIELALYQSEYEPNSPVIQALRDKIQKLREQYNKVQSGGLTGTEAFSIPLEKMPSLLRIYMNLLREQKVLEQVSIFLETQKYSETIQEQTEIPGVDILDSPTIPSKPYSPNRVLITFFTFLFSLVFSVVLVNIREWKLANNKKREA
jgi:uncharacterized protein involved in exopolysaccharide biosynthesis